MFFNSKRKIERRPAQEPKKEMPRIKISRVLFYLLASAFGGVAAFVLFFSSFLEVRQVTFSGVEELNEANILSEMNGYLGGKYLGLISRNNWLLLAPEQIREVMLEKFKKISSVEVEKRFPDAVHITIRERKALFIWCSQEECRLVDESGAAYAPADFDSDEAKENNLMVIWDRSASPIPSDRSVISSSQIGFLLHFRERMEKDLGILLERDFETPGSVSGDWTARTREGWKILLSSDLEAEEELKMFAIVLEQNIKEEKVKDLEYVDLRTRGKVYYKLRNQEQEGDKNEDKED